MGADRSQPSADGGALVTVVGRATLRAEPDEAMVLVTLSALRDTPGPALDDVAGRARAFVAMLGELSVEPSDRSTTGVTVREDFDHTGRRSLGHRAASTVAVRLDDVERIGALITRVTTELDARVDGPRWQLAPDNPIHLRAAREAATDGRRRARAYAEGVGAELGALVGLAEPETSHARRGGGAGWFAAAAADHDMPVDAGELEVTAAIEVTFELSPPG